MHWIITVLALHISAVVDPSTVCVVFEGSESDSFIQLFSDNIVYFSSKR